MSERQSIPERLGHDFLRSIYHMIHAVRMYQDNNQLIRTSVNNVQHLISQLTGSGAIELMLYRSRFHLGGEKLPYRRDAVVVVHNLIEFFVKRGIGSLNFLETSQQASTENIITATRLIIDSINHDHHIPWLTKQLEEKGCTWLKIILPQDSDIRDENDDLEGQLYEKARSTYFNSIETVKEVAHKASQGMVGVRKSRRLAQDIVDMINDDSSLMIGLTTIKAFDDYTYSHSVNVALLATCLGRHIGLSDVALEHLTVCGLFHDLGKVGVPREIVFKHGSLTDEEWEQMKAHPLIGVKKILRLNAPQSLRSRIILGPFEHHLNPDMTGYPQTKFMVEMSLMGKILRIADVYEALTAKRIYRAKDFTPDEALKKMWAEAGKCFDIILLKRFINMMGVYPIGSVVELSDGSIGLVMDYPDETERKLPLVLRLVDDGTGALQRGNTVYLADQAVREGPEYLNIIRGIPPAQLGIQPAEYFLKLK